MTGSFNHGIYIARLWSEDCAYYGTGPTPEAAIADAASKVGRTR